MAGTLSYSLCTDPTKTLYALWTVHWIIWMNIMSMFHSVLSLKKQVNYSTLKKERWDFLVSFVETYRPQGHVQRQRSIFYAIFCYFFQIYENWHNHIYPESRDYLIQFRSYVRYPIWFTLSDTAKIMSDSWTLHWIIWMNIMSMFP